MKIIIKLLSALITAAICFFCIAVPCAAVSTKSSDNLFTENKPEHFIVQLKDGKYKELSSDETTDYSSYIYYKEFATKEMYEKVVDYGYDFTYNEYLDYLLELLGINEKDFKAFDNYSMIYIMEEYNSGSGYGKKDTADYRKAARAAFNYTVKAVKNSSDDNLKKILKSPEATAIQINYDISGEFINVRSYCYSAEAYSGNSVTVAEDYIDMKGKKVFTIDGNPVSADTESIYISVYDETSGSMLDGDTAKDYDTVIYDFGDNSKSRTIDTAELLKNFPKLKKLYISSHIEIKDMSVLSKFKELKELRIDVSEYDDLSVLSGITADKVIISGICAPAKALSEMNVKELCITCSPSENLSDIFELKNVTELTIERYSKTNLDLNGIEKMTGLKKLDISADSGYTLDIAPVGKLKNLEDLSITAYSTKNLDKIAGLTKVKKLMLHSMNEDDLSFLSKMKGLKELSLMYVNDSFEKSLPKLTKVKHLGITDITDYVDYGNIYKMKGLESLSVMGGKGTVSLTGIEELSNLNELNLMLCSYGDLSPVSKCENLKTLMIYNCNTPDFDANDIKGMTQLETLKFNCSDIHNYDAMKTLTGLKKMNLFFCNLTDEEMKDLKKALPKCVITLDTDKTVSADD